MQTIELYSLMNGKHGILNFKFCFKKFCGISALQQVVGKRQSRQAGCLRRRTLLYMRPAGFLVIFLFTSFRMYVHNYQVLSQWA